MRWAGIMGMVALSATPAVSAPITYTFDAEGTIDIESSIGNTSTSMGGTFAVTVYQSDSYIGVSDTIIMRGAFLANTAVLHLVLENAATASLVPGSARFLDFSQASPGHIGPGGSVMIQTDVYVEVTAIVTGIYETTLDAKGWAGTQLDFDLSVTTSAMGSDVLTATLDGQYGYEIGLAEYGLTITLDLIIDVAGTAHVVPDPAFGGLTALSVGAACAWLRLRRRSES